MYIANGNGGRVRVVMYGVGNENICEISVENVEVELINVYNSSWFTSVSWKEF